MQAGHQMWSLLVPEEHMEAQLRLHHQPELLVLSLTSALKINNTLLENNKKIKARVRHNSIKWESIEPSHSGLMLLLL